MFNNKKDPVAESVKAIMETNARNRQLELALNEAIGIADKKALPHEVRSVYDEVLAEACKTGQINEVSKEKLGKYIKKAHYDGGMADFKHGKYSALPLNANKANKKLYAAKSLKREKGIEKATDKLTGKAKVLAKEEQIDEISKDKLLDYQSVADGALKSSIKNYQAAKASGDPKAKADAGRVMINRAAGIKLSTLKLTKKKPNKKAAPRVLAKEDALDALNEERKRTAHVADAFMSGRKAKEKTLATDGKQVTYHGNVIAKHEGDEVHLTTAGYGHSPSTRGHINGILDRLGAPRLSQKKHELYHGDKKIGSNDWIKVKKPGAGSVSEANLDEKTRANLDKAFKDSFKKKSIDLTKKKTVKEEEQIDELSRELVGRYTAKANDKAMDAYKRFKKFDARGDKENGRKALAVTTKYFKKADKGADKLLGRAKVSPTMKEEAINENRYHVIVGHYSLESGKVGDHIDNKVVSKHSSIQAAGKKLASIISQRTPSGKALSDQRQGQGGRYMVHDTHTGKMYSRNDIKNLKEETLKEEQELSHEARELVLHADNDAHLYHSSHEPIVKNLKKKFAKGVYDHEKAKKLWGYHADRAAQSYAKQHGHVGVKWHEMFSKADRKQAASHWADEHHPKSGNLDEKVGDSVHLGLATKGGAGFKGKITKIAGDEVHVQQHDKDAKFNKFGPKTWKGSVKNLSLDEEQLDEAERTPLHAIIKHYGPGEGRHWFDKGTSKFFNSRYPSYAHTTDDGKHSYFVTSEKGPSGVRKHTVRHYDWDKRDVKTVGKFNSMGKSEANTMAKKLAKSGKGPEQVDESHEGTGLSDKTVMFGRTDTKPNAPKKKFVFSVMGKSKKKLAEAEQIAEVSKGLLGRYVNKASDSVDGMSRKWVVGANAEEKAKAYKKINDKIDSRVGFIDKAIGKMKAKDKATKKAKK